MKNTQIVWVLNELKEKGYVSRNAALQNYISRLGAIIHILKGRGARFRSMYVPYRGGKDYRYYLIYED